MANYYFYNEYRAAALDPNATQDDINALGEWFDEHGLQYWNGEYYDADDGIRLYPVYEQITEDQFEIVKYEIK